MWLDGLNFGGDHSSVLDANYPPNQALAECPPGGGGLRGEGGSWRGGAEVQVGRFGLEGRGVTYTCPPCNHSITIIRAVAFGAGWFDHASYVD